MGLSILTDGSANDGAGGGQSSRALSPGDGAGARWAKKLSRLEAAADECVPLPGAGCVRGQACGFEDTVRA